MAYNNDEILDWDDDFDSLSPSVILASAYNKQVFHEYRHRLAVSHMLLGDEVDHVRLYHEHMAGQWRAHAILIKSVHKIF